jgi:hypothetical protein
LLTPFIDFLTSVSVISVSSRRFLSIIFVLNRETSNLSVLVTDKWRLSTLTNIIFVLTFFEEIVKLDGSFLGFFSSFLFFHSLKMVLMFLFVPLGDLKIQLAVFVRTRIRSGCLVSTFLLSIHPRFFSVWILFSFFAISCPFLFLFPILHWILPHSTPRFPLNLFSFQSLPIFSLRFHPISWSDYPSFNSRPGSCLLFSFTNISFHCDIFLCFHILNIIVIYLFDNFNILKSFFCLQSRKKWKRENTKLQLIKLTIITKNVSVWCDFRREDLL